MNNIEVFNDTQMRIQSNEELKRKTACSVEKTEVYDEGFFSGVIPCYADTAVTVEENLTLLSAKTFVDSGKRTAILNFANPIEPGGGVLRGANAQEEYLCRASNLYNCLRSNSAAPYYKYHNDLLGEEGLGVKFLSSDKIIYSPEVIVIKEDVGYTQKTNLPFRQEYTYKWMSVDILTCAAPYFADWDFLISDEELTELFEKRIINIFEVAIEHRIQALILGAFGCGAFSNPPDIVATAFKNVLEMPRYKKAFTDVTFAIKRTFSRCKNLEAFERIINQGGIS